MGLNIAEKQLLKSLEAQEKSGVLDMRPGGKEQLEELRQKQDDQSSLFDNLGIFSTLQASEIDPDNPPSMLPTGAMDRETPFGDIAPGAYGKMGEDVYTKMDDGSTRVDPYASQKFYDNRIFDDYFSTERQFDQIRGGPESGAFGVRGLPQVQNMPIDLEELAALEDDIIEQQLAAASRGEGETFLDRLRDIGGNVLDYIRGGGVIGRGITSLTNMLGDTFRGSRFYNPRTASGNRLFAPGARVGDQVGLNMRRDANRISNMLQRGAAGKNFSQKNLDNVLSKFGITGIDTGGMMDSIAESAQTGYGGYGSSDAAAAAAASGGRDYSSSPGAMAGDMEYGEE